MSIPTNGEVFEKLTAHLRGAQECAAMLAHINRDNAPTLARAWLNAEDMFKKIISNLTQLAAGKRQ